MNNFFTKYYKYLFILISIYLILQLIKYFANVYVFLILIILLIIFYNTNKRLFKKITHKILFNNKNNFNIRTKYKAAKNSLEGISEINKKISSKVSAELINYEKNKLEEQLKYGDYNVTLFGAGSSGKTSLARALLKSLIGNISSTIGTTKKISSYKIRIPILKRNINIIDTPGLFEASEQGEKREKATIMEASKSDLILFVVDQDINKYELFLINKFSEIGKKIIIVLNKCDLRSEKQNNIIKENITSIISTNEIKISIVKTIALPKSLPNNLINSLKLTPDVSLLFKEIINTLDLEGEELLADNILFRCNKLGIISKKVISEQRNIIAIKVINKYMWITGGVILLNPLPLIDFITTTSVNVQLILEISRIYNVKITRKEALDLSKTLITTITKLGILKGGLSIITATLSSNFTSIFIAKSLQSITLSWIIRIVGLSLIEYFNNGQNWGDGGIQEVIDNIYKLNKREEILSKFIKEAITKIKIKEDNDAQPKLPPYFLKD